MPNELPHDAHVRAATKLFRDCGFTLLAMQFPRSGDALAALKRFNGLTDTSPVPFAWGYHPNKWCRDHWENTGELA
jgi:tagatose-1,6-bisphosphate aldolase